MSPIFGGRYGRAARPDEPPAIIRVVTGAAVLFASVGVVIGLTKDSEPIYAPAVILLVPAGVAALGKGIWLLRFGAQDRPRDWSFPPRVVAAIYLGLGILGIGWGLPRSVIAGLPALLTAIPIVLVSLCIFVWMLSPWGRGIQGRWGYAYATSFSVVLVLLVIFAIL